jgi:multisubunit Na+/H+ antiporter MnhB subunit
MVFKWTLLVFGTAMVVLFLLGKVLAFLNPPRPGRPMPQLARRVERALRFTILVPVAVAVLLLVLALAARR